MKFSEVEKKDCQVLADFLNSLRVAKLPDATMLQMVHFVDGVRWLQDVAVGIGKAYAEKVAEPNEPKSPGFTVKTYVPGAVE